MTEIEFHTNVQNKLAFSCRLLRKAYRSGVRAVVIAEPQMLAELDELLWSFSATDFLPHCRVTEGGQRVALSPVLLAATPLGCPVNSVLVNLGQTMPEGFERFDRFLEVISGEDRLPGRERWKKYLELGYKLTQHNAQAETLEKPEKSEKTSA